MHFQYEMFQALFFIHRKYGCLQMLHSLLGSYAAVGVLINSFAINRDHSFKFGYIVLFFNYHTETEYSFDGYDLLSLVNFFQLIAFCIKLKS